MILPVYKRQWWRVALGALLLVSQTSRHYSAASGTAEFYGELTGTVVIWALSLWLISSGLQKRPIS